MTNYDGMIRCTEVAFFRFPHMQVGCFRVSSENDRQIMALQRVTLIATGVEDRHLFEDRAVDARDERPRPDALLGIH